MGTSSSISAKIRIVAFAVLGLCCFAGAALSQSPAVKPSSRVLAVAFSPDGKLLASGGWDGRVKIWQLPSGKPVTTLPQCADPVSSLSFSPDGLTLASVTGDRVRLWNTNDWAVRRVFIAEPYVQDAVFSADSKLIAAAAVDVRVWDVSTGKAVRVMEDDALCVDFGPDGQVVSGGLGGAMVVWDIASAATLKRIQVNDHDIRSLRVSPNRVLVACGGWSDTATVWNISTGSKLLAVSMGESSDLPVCFSPDSKLLAVGGAGGAIKQVDISAGRTIRTLQNGKSTVQSVAYSLNGELIAAGYEDGAISVWQAATGKMTFSRPAHSQRLYQ